MVYRDAREGDAVKLLLEKAKRLEEADMEVLSEPNTATMPKSEQGIGDGREQGASRFRTAAPSTRTVRSLVMWSGGLNSTYALARLLDETSDKVFAHHIHLNAPRDDGKTRSRRCEFEAQAISRLVVPLRTRFRDFEYSESRADLTAFPNFARDATTAIFFAAQLAMSQGFTPLDRILVGVDDEDPRWRPGTELYALRRMLVNRILRAVWESEEVPYFYVFYPRPARADAFAFLGEALAPLTVSCRHPEAGELGFVDDALRPCRACPKCRSRVKLEREAEGEVTAGMEWERERGEGAAA